MKVLISLLLVLCVNKIRCEGKTLEIIVNQSDIRFYLYTQNSTNGGFEIRPEEFDGVINSELYDPSKIHVFSTHGYRDTYLSQNNIKVKNAILDNYDANIFLIDWRKQASEFYTITVAAVPAVGKIVGDVIKKLVDHYQISYDNVNMYGFSAGAHVIGAAGAALNGQANYIMGMDPAYPGFSSDEPNKRLDTTDARFVQVIHTNGGFLGYRKSIGHTDYFPNGGGMDQPGCGFDIFGSCAHPRAFLYIAESIKTSNFRAKSCDNYENYKSGLGDDNADSYMGEFYIDKSAIGDYYLDTAATPPYALNGTHYKVKNYYYYNV